VFAVPSRPVGLRPTHFNRALDYPPRKRLKNAFRNIFQLAAARYTPGAGQLTNSLTCIRLERGTPCDDADRPSTTLDGAPLDAAPDRPGSTRRQHATGSTHCFTCCA
jgi:hypothetical protein